MISLPGAGLSRLPGDEPIHSLPIHSSLTVTPPDGRDSTLTEQGDWGSPSAGASAPAPPRPCLSLVKGRNRDPLFKTKVQ